jgi:hypothetical protein
LPDHFAQKGFAQIEPIVSKTSSDPHTTFSQEFVTVQSFAHNVLVSDMQID